MTGTHDQSKSRQAKPAGHVRHSLRFGAHRVHLPRSRPLRMLLGGALILGGVFAFLPVLGLWMFPLGAAVLSIDVPPIRRLRRRGLLWWGRSGARDRVNHSGGWLRRQWQRIRPGNGT